MKNDLTVALVQANLHWHDPAANLLHLGGLLESALSAGLADLIILPEMFTTGFSMEAATQAEAYPGPTLDWMRTQAARYDAVVTGSVLSQEGGRYYNRLLWVRPDGSHSHYDKRHLFRLAGEHEVYTAGGTGQLVEEWRGWRIRPLICYDLRFPVWSRNSPADPFDLLLYVANWPQVRAEIWKTLLRARAIENLVYVAGVNRLGTDGLGQHYAGHSCLLDMHGEYVAQAGNLQTVLMHTLQAAPLQAYRKQMPFLQDADEFSLRDC